MSKVNVTIDLPLVQRLVKEQFPQWANLAINPVEFSGWDNRTFHLGKAMTVRLPSDAAYVSQVEKEQYWLPKLGPELSLAIPKPIALGKPTTEYPWPWSIYQWLPGEALKQNDTIDKTKLAKDLAQFLLEYQAITAISGPKTGEHNFYRGGSLSIYSEQVHQALNILSARIDTVRASEIWEKAIASVWEKPPIWVHGDIAPGNLLIHDDELSAVIDFGCMCVGDPACDLAIAWTFFDENSRCQFKKILQVDEATWLRGQAWALWKALIVEADLTNFIASEKAISFCTIQKILGS